MPMWSHWAVVWWRWRLQLLMPWHKAQLLLTTELCIPVFLMKMAMVCWRCWWQTLMLICGFLDDRPNRCRWSTWCLVDEVDLEVDLCNDEDLCLRRVEDAEYPWCSARCAWGSWGQRMLVLEDDEWVFWLDIEDLVGWVMPRWADLPFVDTVDDLLWKDDLEVGCEVVLHRWWWQIEHCHDEDRRAWACWGSNPAGGWWNGVVMMLDQSMSQKLEVLMNSKLAHMFELKDVIDLADEVLAWWCLTNDQDVVHIDEDGHPIADVYAPVRLQLL